MVIVTVSVNCAISKQDVRHGLKTDVALTDEFACRSTTNALRAHLAGKLEPRLSTCPLGGAYRVTPYKNLYSETENETKSSKHTIIL